jgi:hypothetical protein
MFLGISSTLVPFNFRRSKDYDGTCQKKPIQIEGCNEFVPIKTIAETNATIPSSPQS